MKRKRENDLDLDELTNQLIEREIKRLENLSKSFDQESDSKSKTPRKTNGSKWKPKKIKVEKIENGNQTSELDSDDSVDEISRKYNIKSENISEEEELLSKSKRNSIENLQCDVKVKKEKTKKSKINGHSNDCLLDENTSNINSSIKQEKTLKETETYKTISKDSVELALKFLENNANTKKVPQNRKYRHLKKYCNTFGQNTNFPEKYEYRWESSSFIIKNIRSCILTRDWSNLTRMLLFLCECGHKKFEHAKEVAKLNLMKNPADIGEECFQEFQEFFKQTKNNVLD